MFLRTIIFALLPILLPAKGFASDWNIKFGFDASGRTDYLRWNIAGNSQGGNPNVLSELVFRDMWGTQVGINAKLESSRGMVVKGNVGMGWVHSGNNRDSDYAGDDKTLEYSRSDNSIDGDHFFDGQLGVGYRFHPHFLTGIVITPYVGYGFNQQLMRLTSGYQSYSRPDIVPGVAPVGAIPALDSHYDAYWWGPWIGAELGYQTPHKDWSFTLAGQYHLLEYYGEAEWNLRADFAQPKSFTHESTGQGLVFRFDVETPARIMPGNLKLSVESHNFWTDEGKDVLYFANGSRSQTQLNEVIWTSLSLSLGYQYAF